MLLTVTVDTEADNLWARPRRYTCDNVARLPAFQALCERHQVRPTYLVSHEVMSDPGAVAVLAEVSGGRRCEIGTHLHPFSTPPDYALTADDRRNQPFAYEYPADVLRAKLDTLTSSIERAFGTRPRTIRWGRWGLDGTMVSVMEAHGYRVDTSITPGIDWSSFSGHRRRRAPSYVRAQPRPYFLDRRDVCIPGDSDVLEVPATVTFRRGWHRPLNQALSRMRLGPLCRAARIGPSWLRPFPWTPADRLLETGRIARRAGCPVLNLMLHSSELLPGGSPYAATEADVARMLAHLGGFFEGVIAEGARSVGLDEVYELQGGTAPRATTQAAAS